MDDANLYEWAGISFGKGDLYRLFLSIKKLAETLPGDTDRIRFVGRISTRGLPYFVVEGINDGNDLEGADEFKQEGTNGANK